jgi:hypothetical protein
MIPLPPKVAPGDPFTAKLWNQLRDAVAALRPQSGANTRITQGPNGFSVSFVPAGLNWDHPFRVLQSGKSITVSPGLVNGIEPTIGGVPISGVSAQGKMLVGGAPKLTLGSDYDAESRSWIVLEVEIGGNGTTILEAKILQTATFPTTLETSMARHPLAVIKNTSGTPVIHQITYHNLAYQFLKPSNGTGVHFFWAA